MIMGAICGAAATYFAWIALDMVVVLLDRGRGVLSAAASQRLAAGWLLMFFIGAVWLMAVMASFGYVYYYGKGTVYSRALRVLGGIFAEGVVIQAVFTVRVAVGSLYAPLGMAGALIGVFAVVSAAGFLGGVRLDSHAARRRAREH